MFDYSKVPVEMKKEKRWVLWKLKKTDDGRTTKIPVNAYTGYGAKSNDATTWCDFNYAISQAENYDANGLGFMLGDGYFGVDIDHEIDNEELINEFIDTLQSYTELSQSKEGIHIICKGSLPVGRRRKGNIEMYDNARFFAMTGDTITSYNINERTNEIKALWEKYLNPKKEITNGAYVFTKERPSNLVSAKLSDAEVLEKAMNSKNGSTFRLLYYGQWQEIRHDHSEADISLCVMLAFWTGRDALQMDRIFRTSGLMRDKWDQLRGDKTYGEIQINDAINKCQDVYMVSDKTRDINFNADTGRIEEHKAYDLNDTGNAQRFVDKFGENIRYNFDNKCWIIWDGKTWRRDNTQLIKSKVDILIEDMKEEAIKEPNEKYVGELLKNIKHLSSNSGKEAMLKEAMHIGNMPTTNADYDKYPYFLNCKNGVVDLTNGTILPHNKKYMLSKNTNMDCDMNAEPDIWKHSIKGIFKGSKELVDFVHKAVGYTLSGDTKEQCFFQCYGNGSNGKSVFLNAIYEVFGEYALNSQVESILTRGSSTGGASSDIARMNGARFVRTNEPSEGSRFNEGLVKQLTGGDVVTARYLYGMEFEFRPVFKLWIATNSKIIVRGTDKGIWRRMRLIPFEATFEGDDVDRNLENKLKAELPQILGWAVKGYLKYQKEGLEMPKEVEDATKSYREEMDVVQSFIKDCVKEKDKGKEKASAVFKAYREWAKNGNEYCMTQSKFGTEMGKRYKKKTIGGYVYYEGFILKENDGSYTFTKE